jgi:hypothetical protein
VPVVEVVDVITTYNRVQVELGVVVLEAHKMLRVKMVLRVLPIQAVEVAVVRKELLAALVVAATAALALSSLKYLTTYPQHSLVALHRACLHPVVSTSTL